MRKFPQFIIFARLNTTSYPMRRLYKILLLFLLAHCYPTAGAQQIIETDAVPYFHTVELIGPLKVELIPSATNRMHITVWEIDSKSVDWRVKDNILTVQARKGMINKQGYVEVKLYYQNLERIIGKGAEVTTRTPIKNPSVFLQAESSNGKMDLLVDTEDLTIHTSGKNTIKVKGDTDYANYRAKLGSRIECLKVSAMNAVAHATEKSEIQLYCTELLDARVKTGGNIFYGGDPAEVKVVKNTMGGVEKIDK